ncbi:MAG: hypothetical protein ACOYYJ_05780 [Chloroflexota bacterium]
MKTSAIVIKLTYPILLLALLAAGAGIFWQRPGSASEVTTLYGETFELFGLGLYRNDTVSYAAQAIGQDAATLLVGIPLLFIGLLLARKGSLRGELLLAGGYGLFVFGNRLGQSLHVFAAQAQRDWGIAAQVFPPVRVRENVEGAAILRVTDWRGKHFTAFSPGEGNQQEVFAVLLRLVGKMEQIFSMLSIFAHI